jgi:hypothetical protein
VPRSGVIAAIGLAIVAFAMVGSALRTADTIAQMRAVLTAVFAVIAVIGLLRRQTWPRIFIAAASFAIWTQLFYPAPREDVSLGWRIAVTLLVTALLVVMNIDIWHRLDPARAQPPKVQ